MLKRLMSSTSALVVWAIPSLRRSQGQLTGSEAELANQAASQAHTLSSLTTVASTAAPSIQTAPGFSHLSSLAAQAGPTIAQALPTATTTGSTLGKAAVAVGIAASMAIPTGVAVDRVRDRAAERAAAPVQAETTSPNATASAPSSTTAAPSSPAAAPSTVDALGSGGFDAITGTSGPTVSTTVPTNSTTIAQQPSTTTTTAPAPIVKSPTAPGPEQPAEESPPPATAAPGRLEADALAASYQGPRIYLAGPIRLSVGGRSFAGDLDGKLLVGDPVDPKDREGPRKVEGLGIRLTLGDIVADLQIRGTAVVSTDAGSAVYDLTLDYTLSNAAQLGLEGEGAANLLGRLSIRGENGTLSLEIPAAAGTADS
jgi:hypothetical protein